MKLTLAIATIFTFTLGFYTTQTIATPLATPKSFTDWCEQKSTLPPPLESNEISDVKPLSALTNLTELSLNLNKISDIKPLSALTQLTFLNIKNNPIARKICPVKPESICQFD